jgi:hypothetical protein
VSSSTDATSAAATSLEMRIGPVLRGNCHVTPPARTPRHVQKGHGGASVPRARHVGAGVGVGQGSGERREPAVPVPRLTVDRD